MFGSHPPFASARAALRLAALVAAPALLASPAAADGLLDTVMEKLNLKAAPSGAAPDFVEHSRPDPDSTGYMPTATAHKVSPLAVKTPDQVEAAKAALDAAKARQLAPAAPRTLAAAKKAPAKVPAAAD